MSHCITIIVIRWLILLFSLWQSILLLHLSAVCVFWHVRLLFQPITISIGLMKKLLKHHVSSFDGSGYTYTCSVIHRTECGA